MDVCVVHIVISGVNGVLLNVLVNNNEHQWVMAKPSPAPGSGDGFGNGGQFLNSTVFCLMVFSINS